MLINLSFTLFQMDNLLFPKNKQYFPKNRSLNLYIQKKSYFFLKRGKIPYPQTRTKQKSNKASP